MLARRVMSWDEASSFTSRPLIGQCVSNMTAIGERSMRLHGLASELARFRVCAPSPGSSYVEALDVWSREAARPESLALASTFALASRVPSTEWSPGTECLSQPRCLSSRLGRGLTEAVSWPLTSLRVMEQGDSAKAHGHSARSIPR